MIGWIKRRPRVKKPKKLLYQDNHNGIGEAAITEFTETAYHVRYTAGVFGIPFKTDMWVQKNNPRIVEVILG